MTNEPEPEIRALEPDDADGWARCRALSFLSTAYFDDVKQRPTEFELPSVRRVATIGDSIVGLIDLEIDDRLATIDSVAVRPDHHGRGIATSLLRNAVAALPPVVDALDAWTRDDPAANSWYRTNGFAAEQHYLHVYASWADDADVELADDPRLRLVGAFMHARLDDEEELRRRFRRVHVCRRYVRLLAGSPEGQFSTRRR